MTTDTNRDESVIARHLGGPLGAEYCGVNGLLPVQETETTLTVCFVGVPLAGRLEELAFLTGKTIVVGGPISPDQIKEYVRRFGGATWRHRQVDFEAQ
jgi:hypothetical protein